MNKAKLKSKKAKPELIKLGQGKRLLELIFQKYTSRSEFARAARVSSSSINEVIWNHKPIKENLLTKIKPALPEFDEHWLLKGTKSELSTNKLNLQKSEKVEEGIKVYGQKCIKCEEKDREINKLKNELIECLKKVSGLNHAS